ncbi:type II secretion system protein N [Pelatocladus sp. BLCC-F211]|uniref:type II secretion system protein N n=1 Tax=Pelatocladus sp. BLCC-F211 TaxID=3342752 RepID=UPI0035B708EF
MSQQASTNLIIPEPSEELITSEPWTMETYADGFIDDLFAEIDSILDGSPNLPSHTVQQTHTHLQTVKIPPIVLPDKPWRSLQTASHYRNNPNAVVVNTAPVSKVVKRVRPKSRHWFSKMLNVGTSLGLAIASIVWLMNSGLFNRTKLTSFQQALEVPQPKLPTKAEIEADFVNYMLGSLAAIDRQEAKTNIKPVNVALTPPVTTNRTALAYVRNDQSPAANLPPVVTANNTSPTPSRSTNVVERIYIPVYQAPLPMRYVPPKVSGSNSTTLPPMPSAIHQKTTNTPKPTSVVKPSPKTGIKPTKPTNVLAVVQTSLKPIDIKTAPITVTQATKPTTNQQPTPVPVPVKTEVTAVASAPNPAYILEGLLESENKSKSTALFQINGVTQRVDIGESIGSSGWTLVDVANKEAIIRRNGEVRSIFAGQRF